MIYAVLTKGAERVYAQYQGMTEEVIVSLNTQQGYAVQFIDEGAYAAGVEAAIAARRGG